MFQKKNYEGFKINKGTTKITTKLWLAKVAASLIIELAVFIELAF